MAKTIEYLRDLSTGPLPRQMTDVETVRLLRAMGWVEARPGPDGVTVERVTFAGEAVLAKLSELQRQVRDADPPAAFSALH